jgi:erythrin-vacuolar iron transport family protein
MKKFSDLTEREVLAVAIASEEKDGRIYMSFAENLAERYPQSARIFEQMAEEEKGRRHMLLKLYEQRFGPICCRFGGRTSKVSCVAARSG